MKEELSIVRDLALSVSSDNDPKGFRVGKVDRVTDSAALVKNIQSVATNELTDLESYYFKLMEERGLVRLLEHNTRVHLTADGQDFCKAVEDKEVWPAVRDSCSASPFSLKQIISSSEMHTRILRAAKNHRAGSDTIPF